MATPEPALPDAVNGKSPRPRRWISLRLRMFVTILVWLVIISVWFGAKGYRQLLAIREIERLGGSVESISAGPEWMRDLLGDERMSMFDQVFNIILFETPANDATLRQVTGLISSTGLVLDSTEVTDAGLAHLNRLPTLERLELNGTQVTDAGLASLKGLSSLRMLHLARTRVTDAGLEHLKQLPMLEALNLEKTQVTDAGLGHLSGLRELKFVNLSETRVTEMGIKQLRAALPDCEIIH